MNFYYVFEYFDAKLFSGRSFDKFFLSFYHNAVPCVGIYRTFQYLIVGHADRIRKHEHMIFDR